VHGKDGGVPLQAEPKRKGQGKGSNCDDDKMMVEQDLNSATAAAESKEMFGVEEAAKLMTNFQQKTTNLGESNEGSSHIKQPSRSLDSGVAFVESTSALQLPYLISEPNDSQRTNPLKIAAPPTTQSTQKRPVTANERLSHPTYASNILQTPQIANISQYTSISSSISRSDREGSLLESFNLPDMSQLNRYLKAYFELFHQHLPFLHQPSFNASQAPSAVLLSILSIGALYLFEQDHAYMLHIGSKLLVNQFLMTKENFSSRKSPLWATQATLLNMIFATWSGDPKGLEWACSVKSLVANMVAGNSYELKLRSQARNGAQCSHSEWIMDEESRRTYYAVYIFFGLLTLTYNHTPNIGFSDFELLDLPASESVWNLSTDDPLWISLLKSSKTLTFKDAHQSLFSGSIIICSAFAARVMINALFLETWYHKRSPEALQDIVTEYKLRLALEIWKKSLAYCPSGTATIQLTMDNHAHPLIANAKAMYRNTIARLLVDLKSVQEALRYHDPYEVAGAMTLSRDQIVRSGELLKVIEACYECIQVAALPGVGWLSQTPAPTWSIEHPLCGFDLIVILSHWLWCIEHDEKLVTPEELIMYHKIRAFYSKENPDVRLSSVVARVWGSMMDDVVVWGSVFSSFTILLVNG